MNISLVSFLFIFFLLFTGCSPQNTQTPVTNVTSAATDSLPTSNPTPTLNSIQQAVATQNAEKANQPTATPVSARTGIDMPADSLQVSSPDGKINVFFGLIDGVPYYAVKRENINVLLPSKLGISLLTDSPLVSLRL